LKDGNWSLNLIDSLITVVSLIALRLYSSINMNVVRKFVRFVTCTVVRENTWFMNREETQLRNKCNNNDIGNSPWTCLSSTLWRNMHEWRSSSLYS
jgi:hypothetical protein